VKQDQREEIFGKARRERKAFMSEDTWKHVEKRRALKGKLGTAKKSEDGCSKHVQQIESQSKEKL